MHNALDDAGLGSSRKINPMQAVSSGERDFAKQIPCTIAAEEQRSNLQKTKTPWMKGE